MAKVKIQGHASGTGILTVTAPNTSTDRTITLPDETATLSTFDPDGAQVFNETGADVDFRVESDTNTHALFVDGASGSVGIGVTPSNWPSNGDHRALQIGTGAAFYGRGTGDESKAGLMANAYADATDDRFEYIGNSYASHYRQNDGNHTFWTAGIGTANAAITFTQLLELKRDGRAIAQYTANAWIHFNGQTPVINDSYNVSSLGDNGTGWFYAYIDIDLENANSAAVASASNANNTYNLNVGTAVQVVSYVAIMCWGDQTGTSHSAVDPEFVSMIVMGD